MYEYPFEKLKIWQSAKELAVEIYITANAFPSKEKNGIGEFLKESAISVATATSEGNWKTNSDNARASIDKAHLALMELLGLIIVTYDLKLIDSDAYTALREKLNDLSIMLLAFKKSLNARNKKDEEEMKSAA